MDKKQDAKKVITGTMIVRWVGILVLVVVPIATIIVIVRDVRSGYSVWNVIADNWIWMIGPILFGALPLWLTAKKEDKK